MIHSPVDTTAPASTLDGAAPTSPGQAPDPTATPLGFGVGARITAAVMTDDYARVLIGILSRLDLTGLVRETGDVDFDEHHQVIASSDFDNDRFAELVGSDLISLMNANTDLLVEVERSEQGDAALLVALPGIGIGDQGLDRLLAATEHVVGLF